MSSSNNNQLANPFQWTTGNDPPTSKQTSFLSTLASSKGEPNLDPSSLSKSDASAKIDELKNKPDATTPGNSTASNSSSSSSGGNAEGGKGGGGGGGQGQGKPAAGGVGGVIQDPDGWATGGDPATGKQTGYIAVMAKEAGEDVGNVKGMGKTEASKKIEELKGKTGM